MAVAVALSSSYAMADTSSAVRGRISTPAGTPAAGTKVIILHVPSGTSRTVTTNDSGSFAASGLRVGGPYKIIVDSETYADETVNDVYLTLGDTYQLNKQLEAQTVERIAVTGSVIASSSSGTASYFGADQIEKSPSLNRDIKDLVRNNPLAVVSPGTNNELSVAGTNPRFNSINVDGIAQNDDFGLNSNGYPTQRPPISMDAIEQISIETSPFNAKASGFQGALIDAVTKSGANETFGSFFYEMMNDGMAGTPYNDLTSKDVELNYDSKTFGGTLGGAIVEDKLFYFVSAEKYDSESQPIWGPKGIGAPSESNVTQASYDRIRKIAQEVYGVDAGSWDLVPSEADEKLLLKIDWNFSDEHRSALTYQYNKGNRTENTSTANNVLRLSSSWYDKQETLNNFAYKLYSDWTSDFSTQLSATYMNVETEQNSFNKDIGDIFILTGTRADVAFGSDGPRHANELSKKTWIFAADGDYLLDDHHFSFGYQLKKSEIYNLFLLGSKGSYRFESIDNFEARTAKVQYTNTNSLNPREAAASFVRNEHAIYGQDEWQFDEFKLTYGLRYERLGSDDLPKYNEAFSKRNPGLTNTENLDGLDIFLPRVGFEWDATMDLVVRGGIGRFSGGQPTVWVSNSYSNSGVGIGQTLATTDRNAVVFQNVSLDKIPQELINQVQSSTALADVNFVDPNYKLPSDLRAQLAADYIFSLPMIGDDISWTTEFLYVQKENDSYWKDLTLERSLTGTAKDGIREIYTVNTSTTKRDIMLTNTDLEGKSKIFSTSLNKSWDAVNVTASYTHQDVQDVHVSTSSTASSNFGNNVVVNRNDAILGRSTFETKHRFVLNLGYEAEWVPNYPTNINVFFERRSGRPVSYVLGMTDIDGSGGSLSNPTNFLSPGTSNAAFLPYIATENDENVRFLTPADKTAYFERIKQLGLDQYAGNFLPKGASTSPWVSSMDLSIRQTIPGFAEGHSGTFYVTINNVLNLLNKDWGKVYGTRFGTINLHDFAYDPATKQYVYANVRTSDKAYEEFYAPESTYRIKVGINYRF